MDGSAADGEHPLFSSLLLVVVIRRLHRTGGTCPARPSAKKDGQEGQRQEVSQEIEQASQEGRQEGGTEVFCQEVRQEIGKEEQSARRQAWKISGPERRG
jgi:hypothetical protein